MFEWYWNQPGVPHVAEFVAAIKKKTGRVPTARTWFGFASAWTCALAANQAKSLDAVKMAKALQGFKLPPEVGLMPDAPFYRAGQTPADADSVRRPCAGQGPTPEDLFKVTEVVKGVEAAGPLDETGCNMTWPA